MDKRIGTYGDKNGKGFVKPQETVTGGNLQKGVAYSTYGISNGYFVYLDLHKNANAEKAIKEVQGLLNKKSKAKVNESK